LVSDRAIVISNGSNLQIGFQWEGAYNKRD
jgi:hypothetical protein